MQPAIAASGPDPDELLLPKNVALILKVQPDTLSKWRQKGSGPKFVRLSGNKHGRVRYIRRDVESYIAAQSGYQSTAEVR